MNNYVLYMAYSNQVYSSEAICSIYSVLHSSVDHQNFQIVIYTDNRPFFEEYLPASCQVEYHDLNAQIISDWVGESGYIYKAKIRILQDFLKNRDCNVLFLDTDTFILSDVNQLFSQVNNGYYYMHAPEYLISSKLDFKFYEFLSTDDNAEKYKISIDSYMTNSGVIGINSGSVALLDDVINLIDELFIVIPWQRVIEQIALNAILSKTNRLLYAYTSVLHYWAFKEYVNFLLTFFNIPLQHRFSSRLFIQSSLNINKDIQLLELMTPLAQDLSFYLSDEYINHEIILQSPKDSPLTERIVQLKLMS